MRLNWLVAAVARNFSLLHSGLLLLSLSLTLPQGALAEVLEGVGYATIVGGDVETAVSRPGKPPCGTWRCSLRPG